MAGPLIIPIFIPNRGCTRHCIFCNERIVSGAPAPLPSADALKERVLAYRRSARRRPSRIEIAFYGGTFTGMPRADQSALLASAGACLREGLVDGLRISTRPDAVDADTADFLRTAGVETVEIGAQSLVDDVLERSRRGHTAADVVRAVTLLKGKGFVTGVHLMPGLPGEDEAAFDETVRRTVAMRPDTVRLHPTLVFRDTALAELYRAGAYAPLTLDAAVETCKRALRAFETADIPVIRLGLQTTAEMEAPGNVLAGPFHPAFRSLVETSIAGDMATRLLDSLPVRRRRVTFTAAPSLAAHLKGARNQPLDRLKAAFDLAGVEVVSDPFRNGDSLAVTVEGQTRQTGRWDPP